MVTKRGRRWVSVGIAFAITAAVIGLIVAAWSASSAIEADLLTPASLEPEADPADAGLDFTNADVPGPLGNYPAWVVAADEEDDTWVVFAHDKGAARDQALDLLPTVHDHGLTALVPTMRDDAEAPPSEGGHHALGADEWQDLEAAVVFALGSGARDVVLVGHGTGGAVALSFVRNSVYADQVAGVILDSAYLDPGSMVDGRMEDDNVPGFLKGWGKAFATFRFGVEWAVLDQVAAAGDLAVEILLIHGAADGTVPVHLADAFAEEAARVVQYLRMDDAGHLGGFEADPERYSGAVGHFLRRVAVGPSGAPEVEPATGAE